MSVRGVCTLDALGRGIQEGGDGGSALAVLDGWRGEVFAALYDAEGERLWDPAVYRPGAAQAPSATSTVSGNSVRLSIR